MAHKKQHGSPVPPANKPQTGPPEHAQTGQAHADTKSGAPFQNQDPKRRLGNFEGAGEHSFQQPGGKNDANR
jgi:hypothetical protein